MRAGEVEVEEEVLAKTALRVEPVFGENRSQRRETVVAQCARHGALPA